MDEQSEQRIAARVNPAGGDGTPQLDDLYNNPRIGLVNQNAFYKRLKSMGYKYTLKEIETYLKSRNNAFQIKYDNKRIGFKHIMAKYPLESIQVDILYMDEYKVINSGYKYLLVIIDVYSRKLFLKPLKTKTGMGVLTAFKQFLDEADEYYDELIRGVEFSKEDNESEEWYRIRNFTSDKGKEFDNHEFKKLLQERGIAYYFDNDISKYKTGIVERVNRTIRNYFSKLMISRRENNFIDFVIDCEENYNGREHSTLRDTPDNVFFGYSKGIYYYRRDGDYNVKDKPVFGDYVRVRERGKKDLITKESEKIRYSTDIYLVIGVVSDFNYYVINIRTKTIKKVVYNDLMVIKGFESMNEVERKKFMDVNQEIRDNIGKYSKKKKNRNRREMNRLS